MVIVVWFGVAEATTSTTFTYSVGDIVCVPVAVVAKTVIPTSIPLFSGTSKTVVEATLITVSTSSLRRDIG